jgi:hypothetical protein
MLGSVHDTEDALLIHIHYQRALTHQDELLRQAANHRLDRQAASTADASSTPTHRKALRLTGRLNRSTSRELVVPG